MSQITIGDKTLNFKDSVYTGDQWEQVASWVLNGGAEGIDANAQIATEKAAAASASAAAARNSATSAGESATAAEESIKHAPRINADGKWELWDATTNAYVATEYTAIGKDGAAGTDGTTPHIGENGNWFLGETDTGVKAAGTDYVLTSADKSEIAGLVLAEIPNGDEVAYG